MIAMDWKRGWGVAGLVATLEALIVAAGLSAQATPPGRPDRPDRPGRESARDCSCVDAQGNAQDRCVCLVMPDVKVGGLMGMARRAVLGVNVRQDQPARYDDQGARLYGVEEEGAAGKAGLEEGDVLTGVDGQNLLEPLPEPRAEDRLSKDGSLPVERLLSVLADHEAGDTLDLEYLRDGERHTARAVLEKPSALVRMGGEGRAFSIGPMGWLDSIPGMGSVGGSFGLGGRGLVLDALRGDGCPGASDRSDRGRVVVMNLGRSCVAGVELLEMQPGLAEYFGAGQGGVLVSNADDDNPLGLRAGDVLMSVDGRAVTDVDHALRLLRSYEADETVALEVLRKQQKVELKGKAK